MIEKIVKINGITRNKNGPIMEFKEELIRCGECRFWPELTWNVANMDLKETFMVSSRCTHMGPEDYCSKAKRRSDD